MTEKLRDFLARDKERFISRHQVNCSFAYLSLNLGICLQMSRSISIMFLVISPGPGLKPGTWQGPPKEVLNECMNDLEIRGTKRKRWTCSIPPSLEN